MRYSIARYLGRSAALAICLLPAVVFAQGQAADKAAAEQTAAEQAVPAAEPTRDSWPASTPAAMSVDWAPMATWTPQV